MATRAGVRQLARAILSYYPGAKIDLATDLEADLWVALFRGVTDKELLLALAQHVRSGNKFAPNAGDIAQFLSPVALPVPEGSPEGRAIKRQREKIQMLREQKAALGIMDGTVAEKGDLGGIEPGACHDL